MDKHRRMIFCKILDRGSMDVAMVGSIVGVLCVNFKRCYYCSVAYLDLTYIVCTIKDN